MIYLLLAIISSALVSLVMRLSTDKVKGNIAMLSVNYLVCMCLAAGFAGFGSMIPEIEGLGQTLGLGAVNGVLYLASFVLFQLNVKRNGVVLASTFMKLGLLVPMVLSILLFGEMPEAVQVIGFVLAIIAILMINLEKDENGRGFKVGLILLLLCGGTADAMSKVFEEVGNAALSQQFLLYTFATAFILCLCLMVYKKQKIGKNELIYGALIGIPNFFSAKFLLKSLESVDAVIAYPTFSVATILVVTLVGVLAFKEKLGKRQWAALGIILAALVLLNI
ncbi:MAG: EamA family transporter [Oscillospiraceae bacterium]|nr:EamA family transporter [Oscillospiraceae bacterium]